MHSDIRKSIVEVAKMMYEKGLANAYEGNISVKEEGKIYITPSSVCKGFLSEEMIVVTDESGAVIEGDKKPSSELDLHLALYKLRSDVTSVVHAHPPYITAFSLAKIPISSKAYPEMMIIFDQIPIVDYGTPSTDRIHAGLSKYIHSVDVVMLEKHGLVAAGNSAYDAFFKAEAAESVAKTLMITRLLGGEKELPEEEIDTLYAMRYNYFGREKI